MADFPTAYSWMMDNEDALRAYKTVPDAPPGAYAISGINSHAFPAQFAVINAILPESDRAFAVEKFYQNVFWNEWYEQLSTNDVAKRVFDQAVNGGGGSAVKILQQAINSILTDPIAVDGGWGPVTVKAANLCNPVSLVQAFVKFRVAHYQNIADNNPQDAQYLNAWLARAQK